MKFVFLTILMSLLTLSFAINPPALCASPQALNNTMMGCIQSGQDAVFVKEGACTVVGCSPKKNIYPPKICLSGAMVGDAVKGCVFLNSMAIVYGNSSCMFISCIQSNLSSGTNQSLANQNNTNQSSLVNQVMSLGNQYGNVIGGVLGALGTAAVAIIGWHYTRKKKNTMGQYLTNIDNAYSQFKMNARQCEAELLRQRHLITEDLKKGNLEEGTYSILEKRIDDYLKDVRKQIKLESIEAERQKKEKES